MSEILELLQWILIIGLIIMNNHLWDKVQAFKITVKLEKDDE